MIFSYQVIIPCIWGSSFLSCNKPPLKRGTTVVPLTFLFHEIVYTPRTPFKWWFVIVCTDAADNHNISGHQHFLSEHQLDEIKRACTSDKGINIANLQQRLSNCQSGPIAVGPSMSRTSAPAVASSGDAAELSPVLPSNVEGPEAGMNPF